MIADFLSGDCQFENKPMNIPSQIGVRAFLVTIFCVVLASAAVAQSGRRAKTPAAPVPVPTPEPTPSPAKPTEKQDPLRFIVAMDRYGSFSTLNLNVYTGIVESCARRLNEPAAVRAETAEREMGRGDAIKRAKAEKETYVIWMRIRPDDVGDNGGMSGNFNEIYIEYTVFEPTTGKQRTTGNAYPRAYKNSTVILQPSGVNGDRYFNAAAREIADKILANFHVGEIRP
jgi:hypothetical protein